MGMFSLFSKNSVDKCSFDVKPSNDYTEKWWEKNLPQFVTPMPNPPYTYTLSKKNPNPNPSKYTILQQEEIGLYTALMVNYPDCTNYEGIKIMVWLTKDLKIMLANNLIDPHFSDNVESCIARFIPTKDGWDMAVNFARNL